MMFREITGAVEPISMPKVNGEICRFRALFVWRNQDLCSFAARGCLKSDTKK